MLYNQFIRVQIPSALEHIEIARYAVDVVGEQIHLSQDARAAVKLAVGEACNNAVLHAMPAAGASVIVDCRVQEDALEIDVTNCGNGFHPRPHAEMPPAEALDEHGRGRALIELMMDSVEYLCDNGNTVVRMRKRLSAGH